MTSTLSGREAAAPHAVATDAFLDSLGRIDAALDETPFFYTERVALGDDSKTTVHVLRQELRNTAVTVADLGSAKRVTDVCAESGGRVVAAMSGGFFAREAGMPLGELWIDGRRRSHVPFPTPWGDVRGSLLVDADGITIDRRDALPARPDGDLLQVGPVLVTGGQTTPGLASDVEGFGAGSGQFDSDITDGRYPRAAIGYDDTYVYAVVVDGRSDGDPLQAGPVLVTDGRANAGLATDGEGFGAASGQFDSDITDGRYPRAAIGYDDTYVYAVVVDGRSDGDAGMSLTELADFMSERLGVTAALNLDGGGSATLAARDPEGAFHVINNPMDAHNVPTPGGSRELYSAIVFTQL